MQEKKFLSLGSNPGPLNVWFPGYHWAEDKMIIDDLQVNMLSQMFQQPNVLSSSGQYYKMLLSHN